MIVKAYVIASPSVTRGRCNSQRTSRSMSNARSRPAHIHAPIEFEPQLPKTETGKLKRCALRQLAQAAATSSGVAAE